MYIVAHGSGKSGFLPRLNLWYSDAAAADKGPTGLLLCSCRVPASVYRGRTTVGAAPQKKGFGAQKSETAERWGSRGRAVRLGSLGLIMLGNAGARKSC